MRRLGYPSPPATQQQWKARSGPTALPLPTRRKKEELVERIVTHEAERRGSVAVAAPAVAAAPSAPAEESERKADTERTTAVRVRPVVAGQFEMLALRYPPHTTCNSAANLALSKCTSPVFAYAHRSAAQRGHAWTVNPCWPRPSHRRCQGPRCVPCVHARHCKQHKLLPVGRPLPRLCSLPGLPAPLVPAPHLNEILFARIAHPDAASNEGIRGGACTRGGCGRRAGGTPARC